MTNSPDTDILKAFDEIIQQSHIWNWSPDWYVAKKIYQSFPDSYSVLTPFAYSYLEELIRSTTSEYGVEIYDSEKKPKRRCVGMKLIELAKKENEERNPEFVLLLEEMKNYFKPSTGIDNGENRNSVAHGYMHPRYWSSESFENLILDLAKLSKFGKC